FLFIMPKLFGVTGIWLAFPLSNIALSLVVISMLWRDVKKLLNETSAEPTVQAC
ncbi:MATE family efflux transporter, partial [Vibrio parahaemolyticus]|nr:MATE family efflux transporter [Vibrio parahaemolyticus]